MKLCWNDIDNLRLSKRGNFIYKSNTVYIKICIHCKEEYIGVKNSSYCCKQCLISSELMRKVYSNKSGIKNGMYGKNHTEESKQKISNKLKGRNGHRGEFNGMYGKGYLVSGIKNGMYGKNHTEETKRKISEFRGDKHHSYGKKFTEEHRRKMSDNRKGKMLGPNNPNWKGGISCEPYCEVWTDREYKNWIRYERDNRCYGYNCSGKCTLLVVHHINYDKKDCRPENLITLCRSCHGRTNANRKWHQDWYNEIMKRKKYVQ